MGNTGGSLIATFTYRLQQVSNYSDTFPMGGMKVLSVMIFKSHSAFKLYAFIDSHYIALKKTNTWILGLVLYKS